MHQHKRKVLLAEHVNEIRDILLYLLKAWDYDVVHISDGTLVQDLVRKEQPDIIIVDSNLQKLDGLKVSRLLKEDFLTAHIPIIILIDRKQIRKKMLDIEQGVDDYLANPPDPIDLEVRMEMALRRTTHQLSANALTRLPGNRQIEKIVHVKLDQGLPFSVAYYDIDNFKTFNDKYGYMKGDSVIRHVAYIISTTVKRYGNKDDFVGHIGGDDFVVVTTPERDRLIASESILTFNRIMAFHYTKEDRERGHVVAKDRRGNVSNMPLMSISIAIVNNKNTPIKNMVELMETITEIKHYLKTLPGSNFLVNRRQIEKKIFIDDPQKKDIRKQAVAKHKVLGQILLESKVITPDQLETALNKHWSTGQKIGQSIIGLGMASPGDIVRALESQMNVPHLDARHVSEDGELKEVMSKIPIEFLNEYGVVPVRKEKDMISLAMVNPKDIETIAKIKNITGCNVATFLVLEGEFREILEKAIKKADKGD
ncbi:MAG: diguanylate cyclase [Candidatus Omnitrophota bacterium]